MIMVLFKQIMNVPFISSNIISLRDIMVRIYQPCCNTTGYNLWATNYVLRESEGGEARGVGKGRGRREERATERESARARERERGWQSQTKRNTQTHPQMHTCTYACKHTRTHARTDTCMHAYMHTRTHAHPFINWYVPRQRGRVSLWL